MTDLADLSARELAARIRRKEISPVDAVQAALARIAARRELNAFITVTADQALEAARCAEQLVMAVAPCRRCTACLTP
jgi:aspartyl-tRNA(Asn)/glutamyl-tRNA(Gln) amidotransferase subunit A